MTSPQQRNPSQQIKTPQTLGVNIDGCINLDTNSYNIIKFANFDHNDSVVINEKFILNIGGRNIPCSGLMLKMDESKNVAISKISVNGRDFIDFKEVSQALLRPVSSQIRKESSDLKALKPDSLESYDRLKLNDIVQSTIKILSHQRTINSEKAKKIVDRVEGTLCDSLRTLGIDKTALSKFYELANLLKSNKKASNLATLALLLNSNGLNNKNREVFEPIKMAINQFLETSNGRNLNTSMKGVKPSKSQQMEELALVLGFIKKY
jgi:hypothetical protein